LIIAVPHRQYTEHSGREFVNTLKPGGCIVDVKSMLDAEEMKEQACNYWRL
jgi:hypothetical protein